MTTDAACGATVGVIGASAPALKSQVNTIEIERMAIMEKIHDLGPDWATPGTAAMADAGATDGDEFDWRPGS